MTEAAELAPPHQVVNPEVERDREAVLAMLRLAHIKLRIILNEVEDIGTELKDGRLTPVEAMRACMSARIDTLFPREPDGA